MEGRRLRTFRYLYPSFPNSRSRTVPLHHAHAMSRRLESCALGPHCPGPLDGHRGCHHVNIDFHQDRS